jgi:hypothetical protein
MKKFEEITGSTIIEVLAGQKPPMELYAIPKENVSRAP